MSLNANMKPVAIKPYRKSVISTIIWLGASVTLIGSASAAIDSGGKTNNIIGTCLLGGAGATLIFGIMEVSDARFAKTKHLSGND